MSLNEPKFDAHLVGVYDRLMGFGKHETTRFYMKGSDVDFDGRTLEAIGRFTRSSEQLATYPQFFLDNHKRLLRRIAESGLDPKIVEVLQNSRIKIDMLINTDGAFENRLDALLDYLDVNKERGGEFNTYGGIYVSSGGAVTWQQGARRHLLDISEVLWHTSASEIEEEPADEESKRRNDIIDRQSKELDLAEARSFLEGAIEPYRTRYLEILKEDVDSRHEIRISGSGLKDSGLAHNAFPKITAMKAHFEADCDWAKNKPRVKKFWTTIRRQEREIIDAFLLWELRSGKKTEL